MLNFNIGADDSDLRKTLSGVAQLFTQAGKQGENAGKGMGKAFTEASQGIQKLNVTIDDLN